MDPGDVPPELQGLTQVEQMLIAKACAIMRVYRLKGGQRGFSGHVVNVFDSVFFPINAHKLTTEWYTLYHQYHPFKPQAGAIPASWRGSSPTQSLGRSTSRQLLKPDRRSSPRSTMASPLGTPATSSRFSRRVLGLPRPRPMSANLSADRRGSRSDSVRSVVLRRCYNRSFAESQRWRQEKLKNLRDVIRASPVEAMTERLRDLELTQVDGGDLDKTSGEGLEGHLQHDHVAPVQWDAKDVMTKVLEARDMRDRRSLLEYAAVMGRGGHVRELARWLRWKLGVGGLVKQLRDPGVDGAPLLFHAATNTGCLRDVTKVIVDTIGLGGLMHQVQATDQNGHTLLMYAARYADPKAFTFCLELVRDLLGKEGSTEYDRQLTKATLGVGGLTPNEDQTKRTASLLMYAARYATVEVFVESFNLVKKLLEKNDKVTLAHHCKATDSEDRTLVHYAAEARDDDMLHEVQSKLESLELWDSLKKGVDKQGRTPAMCLLGCRGRSSELKAKVVAPGDSKEEEKTTGTAGTASRPQARVNTGTEANGTTQMTSMETNLNTLLSDDSNLAQPQTSSTGVSKGLSGIMHAARGGWEAFDLACRVIAGTDGARSMPLDMCGMLDLGSTPDKCEEYKWGCGHLIAQAALGGDGKVLNEIEKAMLNTSYSPVESKKDELNMWAKKTDYPMISSDIFHATRRGRLQGFDHGSTQSESRDMGDSVYCGKSCDLKASLLTLTVLSGNKDAVNWAANFGRERNTSSEATDVIWAEDEVSPLAYATWTACTPELFNAVCNALAKSETAKGKTSLQNDMVDRGSRYGLTPLAGALFRGDKLLVEAVLEACRPESLSREEIKRVLVGNEVASKENDENLYEIQRILRLSELCITKDVDAVLKKVLKNYKGVSLKGCLIMSTRAIDFNEEVEEAHPDAAVARAKEASEGGAYDGLRALIEKGWYCLDYLPEIISRIGHHEAGVISTVLCTVENARTTRQRGISNPFVVGAIASSHMADARKKRPEDAHRLGKLQREIDTFTIELLSKLPSTVRGVGLELMGSFGDHTSTRQGMADHTSRQDMANLVGYIAVRWMLEPSLTGGSADCARSGGLQPDPLQQALNRGPKAYEFVNTPLVLNYMQLKWSCTIPRWTRRYPLDYNINEGFYTYGVTIHDQPQSPTWADDLLRFIQGWAPTRDKTSSTDGDPSTTLKGTHCMRGFPRTTVLPSLQFSMAGIVGRPQEFFLVPSIRFFYEAFSYLFMLGLYCSCVSIADGDVIPANEIAFYVFALGLLWREVLEFRDVMPLGPTALEGERPPDTPHNRLTTGAHRYFSQDNWNILDTAAISCIMVAFFFRILALWLYEDADMLADPSVDSDAFFEEVFFFARLFLAVIAPLLFARVLSLAQVEKYLGPMTQIIWAMLFHLARFSLFILVVMVSFALAFFALFNSCEGDLFSAYGTMGKSLLSMFTAMLGEPDFAAFDEEQQACPGPFWQYDAGIALLVLYMVTMSILMLNLLIAVLSTVHDTVHGRAELEFQLARNQFIQHGAGVVHNGRLPPPLNLVIKVFLIVVDVLSLLRNICRLACTAWHLVHPKQPQVSNDPDDSRRRAYRGEVEEPTEGTRPSRTWTDYSPLSEESAVIALQGALERLIFAVTMGLFALGGTAILWGVSLPSVALRIVRWKVSAEGTRLRRLVTFLHAGHVRPVILILLRAIGLVFGLVAAVFLCLFCVMGSVVLWVRGLFAVAGWWRDNSVRTNKPRGNVMAGTSGVEGGSWNAAMDIVETSNCSWNAPKSETTEKKVMRHFDVELLLNLTTGWRLSHISSLVRRKEEKRGAEKKMLKEIDDKQRGVANGLTAGTTATAQETDGPKEPTSSKVQSRSSSKDLSPKFNQVLQESNESGE